MSHESDVARRYREHAKQLRAIASDADHKTRGTLSTIADEYEQMARDLESSRDIADGGDA